MNPSRFSDQGEISSKNQAATPNHLTVNRPHTGAYQTYLRFSPTNPQQFVGARPHQGNFKGDPNNIIRPPTLPIAS